MVHRIITRINKYAARHPWRAALIFFSLIPIACFVGWLLIKTVLESPGTTFFQKTITLLSLTGIALLIGLVGFRLSAIAGVRSRSTPNLPIIFFTVFLLPGLLFGITTLQSPELFWRPGLGMPWLYFWQNGILLIIVLIEKHKEIPENSPQVSLLLSIFTGFGVGICSAFIIGLFDSISIFPYEIPELNIVAWVLIIIASLLVAPYAAEIIFRRRLLDQWQPRMGFTRAMLASSAVYALLQLRPLVILPAFFLGCGLCWLYRSTARLIYPVIAHAVFNVLMLVLGWWLVV